MNPQTLDLNLLRVFDAVMAERSVTRAADRLFLSQPAVSHALNRLRHAVGDELFVKGPEGMRPTPRALEMAQPVHGALTALESSLDPPRFDPRTSTRTFRIATHDYLTTVLIADFASRFTARAPGVSVRLRPTAGRALEQLDAQEVDVVVTAFGELPERFAQRVLFRDRYVCVIRQDHPLAGRRLTLKRFAAASHLLISPRGDERGFVDDALSRKGLQRHVALIINNFAPALDIVASTDLVLTVPARIAAREADASRVTVLPCPVEAPDTFSATSVIWHREFGAHPALDWLRDTLADACADW